MLETNTFKV